MKFHPKYDCCCVCLTEKDHPCQGQGTILPQPLPTYHMILSCIVESTYNTTTSTRVYILYTLKMSNNFEHTLLIIGHHRSIS